MRDITRVTSPAYKVTQQPELVAKISEIETTTPRLLINVTRTTGNIQKINLLNPLI